MATKRERDTERKKKPPAAPSASHILNFGERLLAMRDEFEGLSHLGSDRAYTRFLGLTGTTAISQMTVPLAGTGRPPEPRLNKVAQIWKVFRENQIPFNPDWFITGEGSMVLKPQQRAAASSKAPESSVRPHAPPALKRALEASTPQRSTFVEEVALMFARRLRHEMSERKWSSFLDELTTVEHNGLRAAAEVDEPPTAGTARDSAKRAERREPKKAAPVDAVTKAEPLEWEERHNFEGKKKAEHEDD